MFLFREFIHFMIFFQSGMSMRKDGLNKTQNQNQKLNLNVDDFGCSIGGESPQFAEIIKDALDYCELEDSLFLAELYHAKGGIKIF